MKFSKWHLRAGYCMTILKLLYLIDVFFPGIPSPPVNLKVKQLNGSDLFISWDPPVHPNGIITKYRLRWTRPESKPITLALMDNKTSHVVSADFQDKQSYIFTVRKHAYPSRELISTVSFWLGNRD